MRPAVGFLGILVMVSGACGGGDPDTTPDADVVDPDATPELGDYDALFDPDHIVEVSIELDDADWDELRFQTRTFTSVLEGDCLGGPIESPFTTFEADLTVDGDAIGRVGIKKK